MLRNKIQSMNLVSVGWENGVLEVEFHPAKEGLPGPVYQYTGVPNDIYWEMTLAHSPGQYFYAHIRGKYRTRKLEFS